MSVFDVELLAETVIDEPNATTMDPVPEGEYDALVDGFTIRAVTTKRGEVPVMDVTWMIPDEDLKARLNREMVTARQTVWIDLNEDGSIAVGPNQNVGLGRLRAALNLNKKGFMFSQLTGAGPARVLITHRANSDTGDVYSEVKKVVPSA